jgi:hypothetical protein
MRSKTDKKAWLCGWRNIANLCDCSVATVQMLVKKYSMPVRQLPNGTPVAIPEELQLWLVKYDKLKKTRLYKKKKGGDAI